MMALDLVVAPLREVVVVVEMFFKVAIYTPLDGVSTKKSVTN